MTDSNKIEIRINEIDIIRIFSINDSTMQIRNDISHLAPKIEK